MIRGWILTHSLYHTFQYASTNNSKRCSAPDQDTLQTVAVQNYGATMEHAFSGVGILSVILSESHSKADHFAIATPNVTIARLNVRFRHVPLPLWDFDLKANPRSTGLDAIKMLPQTRISRLTTPMATRLNHYCSIWLRWAK
jgi:alpha-D-ribose 1-methylphosphonate 5-phosphate C-P lyase